MEEKSLEFKIPIEIVGRDFGNHLKIKNNSRIFFSGKFGCGKTYFLNELFKENPDYDIFHLYPVNYQISSNENIIELIKLDILVELFQKEYGNKLFQKISINDFLSISIISKLFWDNNSIDIFKNILGYIPELGRPLQETVGLTEKLFQFTKSLKEGEKKIIEDYISSVKKLNIQEEDSISEFIKKSISENKGEKKSILIIDDLDRIDPEHIFRILNIFSAHFRENNTEIPNKFGFDKIILVGDIDNIKSIFYHKYGENTDFLGYMDKFYDGEIFKFENNSTILEYLDQKIIPLYHQGVIHKRSFESSGYTKYSLFLIIRLLLEQEHNRNKISLRQLLKGVKIPISSFQDIKRQHEFGEESFYYIQMGLDGIIELFGDKNDLLESLKKLEIKERNRKYSESYHTGNYNKMSKLIFVGLELPSNHNIFSKHKSIKAVDTQGKIELEISSDNYVDSVNLFLDLIIYYYENY